MAKKITFPNRPCPGCGAPIHIKSRQHECGWAADAQATKPTAKRGGGPKKPAAKASVGSITLDEISAVKAVVDTLGAEKVQQLARVLAK
jgi:hypothetical protein